MTKWSVRFQRKPFIMTVIQVYAPTTNAKEAKVEWFYEDLQDLLELTFFFFLSLFHHRGLERKSGMSRDTWSNRQVWPWSTKWSRAKANRVLPRECTGHSKHPLPTTQEMTQHMGITRWPILKSYWLYILCSRVATNLQFVRKKKIQYLQSARKWSTMKWIMPVCIIYISRGHSDSEFMYIRPQRQWLAHRSISPSFYWRRRNILNTFDKTKSSYNQIHLKWSEFLMLKLLYMIRST